jgi:uncharacterized protein
MTTELITIDFGREFPVFPMKDSVLLPQAVMPLQVFEPRYVKLLSDVLDGSGMMAMALFEGPVDEADYLYGTPTLKPFVCVGHVRDYSRLDEGRYLVLLQGLCRARIEHEVGTDPYRVMKLSPAEQYQVAENQLAAYRRRIEELMQLQVTRVSGDGGQEGPAMGLQVSTQVMVDVAIAAVCKEAKQQYRMLSQPDIRLRAEWLIHKMESILGQDPGHHAHN